MGLRFSQQSAEGTMEQFTASAPTFHVSIKGLWGREFYLPVRLDDTVEELKARMHPAPDQVRLIYGGREMEDNKRLRDYGVTPNCVIYYVLRLRGGSLEAIGSGISSEIQEESQSPSALLTDEASGNTEESKEAVLLGSPEQEECHCKRQALTEVTPEMVQTSPKSHIYYRAHFPGAGSFQCSVTGLGFEVNSAVTIQYRYASWNKHLSADDQEEWVITGPLFHIKVHPGAVGAVHLPHFVCLTEGVDVSNCRIAHFKSGRMTAEKPTQLNAFYAVLENPSFSLLGVFWRRLRSTLNSLPMHSLVLIFQQLRAADTTLHLYLIPDDNSVKQAIEKQETNWNSRLIPKPSPQSPLVFGCSYQVCSTPHVVITPEPLLPFCYKSPKQQQFFIEIYIRNMADEIWFRMIDKRDGKLVWRASLRSGDINPPSSACRTLSGAVFMKEHKNELCRRMGSISPILLHLRDADVINSDEEEEVRSQDTSRKKNRVLLQLVERKGPEAQEQVYKILLEKDPFLMKDLEKSS
ncbi:caspase recruitment domain-containing protein 8-like [Rhea pennata]|uniref:caspase recruitment domain-containing protein 8-like n=1 Tax=Rhea pennata TaxID=8795 RepID=UPI002E25BCC4